MKNTSYQKFITFNKSQRLGLLYFFAVIIAIFSFTYYSNFSKRNEVSLDEKKWIAFQKKYDSAHQNYQEYQPKIYPFNPNFITDYKGFQLGMSVAEIDRLLEFRKTNQFVNSAAEFQKVTKVSDSLLEVISPLFKFPDWVNKSKSNSKNWIDYSKNKPQKKSIKVLDINLASQEDLMKLFGVGEAISERILKERSKYGAFVNMDQTKEIWGLKPEVIDEINKYFIVEDLSNVKKYSINTLSVKEMSKIPFLTYNQAKEIVIYRSMNGKIKGIEDLKNIKVLEDKNLEIIAQYFIF